MRFFLRLFYMFHLRYSNCRPLNSARYNRIICQTVENCQHVIFREAVVHIARVGERIKNPFLDSPKGTHPKCKDKRKIVSHHA